MVQTYRLAITHIEQTCLVELTWGDGMQLTATLPYPKELMRLYQQWQRDYYHYYRTLPTLDGADGSADSRTGLRARIGAVGQVPVEPTDLRSQLAQAEVRLLNTFHRWLESRELLEIRGRLRTPAGDKSGNNTLFITCSTGELRRLPWETWELTREFGQGPSIGIARLPINIPVAATPPRKQRGKAKALVIIGDDTGLDFKADLKAIEQLDKLVVTEVVGWQPGINPHELIDQIRDRIRHPNGWDILFFFGHSNEAAELGGEIAIAPNTALSIRDLEADLSIAKRNGLQFALFNSCKGLDIAQRLVALGLNQVVIMREPIHNQVAQYFLLQFLQHLAQFKNVQQALQQAAKALKSEKNIAYPSAYLVPSLFSHRGAELFRLQPVGWWAKLRSLLPSRRQGMVLGAIAILSLLPSVRDRLMAGRLWTQAVYRHVTSRPLQADVSPPVLLVHIDEESIRRGISDGQASPINRAYLAALLDRLVELDSQVIGVDYLLDRQQEAHDARLAMSIEQAVDNNSWLIFASWLTNGQELGPRETIFNPDWGMQGYINAPYWYLKALQMGQHCQSRCPFSYLLAVTQAALQSPAGDRVIPSSDRISDLRKQLFETTFLENNDPVVKELYHYRLSLIFSLSRWIEQRWFQPILDFSLPPTHIYKRLSAYELLERDIADLEEQYNWQNQVVLIGADSYTDDDLDNPGDSVPNPPAIQFWRDQAQNPASQFTGVEGHGYTIHHFLNRHWVTPIPNLWAVGFGAFIGAISVKLVQRDRRLQHYRWHGLLVFSMGYGLISIVVYGTALLVVPWLLPTAAVWVYHIPNLGHLHQRKNL